MTKFIPTSATTYCDVVVGDIDNTIDGNDYTFVQFGGGGITCLTQWEWGNEKLVNDFHILSSGYTLQNNCHIYGIWLKINGSYERIFEGERYLPNNDWFDLSLGQHCSGIRIAQRLDGSGSKINEVYGEEQEISGCTNPSGAEGQVDDCGCGYGGQPDPLHKYKCVSGVWVDQGYNFACGSGGAGSANFQESSADVGDTIHADFTWSDAMFNGTGGFAQMVIQDPNGDNCDGYIDVTHSDGSRTLSCTTDMAGTWTAKISVWTGLTWIEFTDTVNVISDTGPYMVFRHDLSTWYDGPFSPGSQNVILASAYFENVGDEISGLIYIKLVAYPGQSNEIIIKESQSFGYLPGDVDGVILKGNIPANATNSLPLGIKIWGESELEPSW